jgi:amino acid transporter
MWKLILAFSLLGGLLLILSRSFGSSLHYLSGYLYIVSYALTTILIILTGKKMEFSFSDNLKIVLMTFVGMTLLYILNSSRKCNP